MSYSKAICSGHVKIYSLKFTGLRESKRIMQENMFHDNWGLTQPCFLKTASNSIYGPSRALWALLGKREGEKKGELLIIAICKKHPCLHVGVTSTLSERLSSAEPPFPVSSQQLAAGAGIPYHSVLVLQKRKMMASGGGRGGGNPLK